MNMIPASLVSVVLAVALGLLLGFAARADTVTFDTAETIDTPTATKMRWRISDIDAQRQRLRVEYIWLDADDNPIRNRDNSRSIHVWQCLDTCFTSVFGFNIRTQDVGTAIGVGLRTLIWNQMKDDVLTPGNDGTFQ